MANRGTWKLTVAGTDLATYEDVLDGFGSGGGPEVQTEPLAWGTQPFRAGRDNAVVELQFTLTKEHASNTVAASFFMLSPLTYNGVKDVVVKHTDHAGAEATWNLASAEVRVQTDAPIGVTTISRVNIKGYPIAA